MYYRASEQAAMRLLIEQGSVCAEKCLWLPTIVPSFQWKRCKFLASFNHRLECVRKLKFIARFLSARNHRIEAFAQKRRVSEQVNPRDHHIGFRKLRFLYKASGKSSFGLNDS